MEKEEVSRPIEKNNILDINRLIARKEAEIVASRDWNNKLEELDSPKKKLNKLPKNEKDFLYISLGPVVGDDSKLVLLYSVLFD